MIDPFGAYSSAVELLSYTQAVIGSNPFAPRALKDTLLRE